MMKARGTYLVADIYNDDYILGKAVEFGLPKENVDKEKMVGRLQRENFAKAVAAGVKIAFGTDAGVYPHGDNAKQFHYMVKFGMTPAGAIRAATSSAATPPCSPGSIPRERQVMAEIPSVVSVLCPSRRRTRGPC